MDYSAANLSLWNIIIQLGLIAGAILLANLLRQRVPFIRRSLISAGCAWILPAGYGIIFLYAGRRDSIYEI